MNQIRSYARVLLSVMGIYFAIRLIGSMLPTVAILASLRPQNGMGWMILSVALHAGCLVAVLYVLVWRRDTMARWIVGDAGPAQTLAPTNWLPAAYRLVCLLAGLSCLFAAAGRTRALPYLLAFREPDGPDIPAFNSETITILFLLAAGIYLVLGAPHLVRWHVKKTNELCRQ